MNSLTQDIELIEQGKILELKNSLKEIRLTFPERFRKACKKAYMKAYMKAYYLKHRGEK